MRLLETLIAIAEKIEHHRTGPNCGDRVSNIFPVDIRRGTVDRLEERRESAFRIQVGGWGNANGAGAGRAKIGKDIAKQIGRHHHIEAFRLHHKTRAENINMLLVPADLRVILGHCFHSLIPVRHADG
ncbi:Uncharacterised protein [Shigella sonnei]|nr:Uncharacterised protein [Shigella sonnei]